ncbi:hypothetical protein L2750_11540 [Shewanella submarina]|uniref:Uncharacterized protein n=1 Tax=Shewanella submarina TaxID=2016376 RepID=A0ABV7GB06_9GAMM|nr:hypothetical protein [Shewanella submarina]MCL1037783.1 hypothetical protein [Shewanella submarina]
MSSGIVFRGVDYDCTNGMAEYLLDLCIQEFSEIEEYEEYPHVLEFFSDYREMFFGGLIIFLNEEDFEKKSDYIFLSKLFARVFDFAESNESELTDIGKAKVSSSFRNLVEELKKYGAS